MKKLPPRVNKNYPNVYTSTFCLQMYPAIFLFEHQPPEGNKYTFITVQAIKKKVREKECHRSEIS